MSKIYSKKSIIIRVILSILIVIIGVLGFVFQPQIEAKFSSEQVKAFCDADFKMYVVDVGQGDSIFLEFSDNKNMLIDCGPKKEREKLHSFLDEKKVSTINYLVYTHPDEDHVGGGAMVFENYNVEVLYRPKVLSITENSEHGNPNGYNVKIKNGATYDNSIMCADKDDGCQIKYSFMGEEIVGSDYVIKFLSPDEDNYNLDNNSNAYSCVLMVEVNGKKVLLTGDAESDIEQNMITNYGNYLDADVLKVAHHGSKTASSADFLDVVTPDYALISAGVDNRWDMPHEDVIERLNTANVSKIYATNSGSTISLGILDDGRIIVFQNDNSFKFDMVIFVCVLAAGVLLVWGIIIKKPKNKKQTSAQKKKNSKK